MLDQHTGPSTQENGAVDGATVVGVDVGGTFTDAIAIDEDTGRVRLAKVPSTPENQAEGVSQAIFQMGVQPPDIGWFVHSTTVGTNALLERRGASCGMITTRGFRDVLELGRRERPQLYGLFGRFDPLIPRDCRLEVSERIDAEGAVVDPLDEEGLRRALGELRRKGVESVLIAFMHSYANRTHEDRAKEVAREVWPNEYVTTSAEILGEFREFERFGTAAVNAYVQPQIDRYLDSLARQLRERGLAREMVIMQANGGIMSVKIARETAVNTVLSGPAAGVIAASAVGLGAGFPNVISADMGGTSFDVGMVVEGEAEVTSERDLAYNVPVRVPLVDVHTIGAGGGSIAHVTEGGLLQVGPQSAGAVPGPISYKRGGVEPTVTDANVLLGRLPHEGLLAVDGAVDRARLAGVFGEKIGGPLGLDVTAAAAAVLRIIDDKMAAAIRLVSLQRGHDPREFALFASGGAGPLHAVALARELEIPTVIVPSSPGITAALGCVVADVRHDFVQTLGRVLEELTEENVRAILTAHRAEGERLLRAEGIRIEAVSFSHEADMQYEGQTHTVRIAVAEDNLSLGKLRDALSDAYRDRYGIDLSTTRPRLINLRTRVDGRRPASGFERAAAEERDRGATLADARYGSREVWFAEGWYECPLYDRRRVPIGAAFDGPAVLTQLDTTTVLDPRCRATVDDQGNLVVEVR